MKDFPNWGNMTAAENNEQWAAFEAWCRINGYADVVTGAEDSERAWEAMEKFEKSHKDQP